MDMEFEVRKRNNPMNHLFFGGVFCVCYSNHFLHSITKCLTILFGFFFHFSVEIIIPVIVAVVFIIFIIAVFICIR